jgi:NSS family neurotransmitter:Na+ symporter
MSRQHWSGRLTFVLAAAGSAIGLGNIWKFPYMAGVNGGGAFVLIYLACVALVGLPIFIAELYIGKEAQTNTVNAFEVLHKKNSWWKLVGFMGVIACFIILSYYSVVGGWVMDFLFKSMMNQFSNKSAEEIQGLLSNLMSNGNVQIFWHFIFMAITVVTVLFGIKDGIETVTKYMMPALFLILIFLFFKAFMMQGFSQAFTFLFKPDVSKLTGHGILEAVGHAFFTLSLGMGSMITYGSYLKKSENVTKTALIVSILDTLVALFAGIIIFTIVFSYNFEPGAGPGLLFKTLPVIFSQMTGGGFIAVLFFLLVFFAAYSSSIAMLEVCIAYWIETHNVSRKKATIVIGALCFLLGILSALSTNSLSEVKILGYTFFDFFDKLTSSYMLPIGGLLVAIFFGWILGSKAVQGAFGERETKVHPLLELGLLLASKFFAPLFVIIFLIFGILKGN